MTTPSDWSPEEIVDYLLRYADEDWLMMSTVAAWAEGVTGPGSTPADIAEAALRLSAVLIDHGCPPGDLTDDLTFIPWPGDGQAQLDRLRNEMAAFVARGQLPTGEEVGWFHRVDES